MFLLEAFLPINPLCSWSINSWVMVHHHYPGINQVLKTKSLYSIASLQTFNEATFSPSRIWVLLEKVPEPQIIACHFLLIAPLSPNCYLDIYPFIVFFYLLLSCNVKFNHHTPSKISQGKTWNAQTALPHLVNMNRLKGKVWRFGMLTWQVLNENIDTPLMSVR